MEDSPPLRDCPTRTNGAEALFAHKVTQGVCQDRQRNRYHKCYTCGFNNARVAIHGLPTLMREASLGVRDAAPEAGGVQAEFVASEPVLAPGFVEIT
jgi:hypothetical protein